jgi:hypothetical protein
MEDSWIANIQNRYGRRKFSKPTRRTTDFTDNEDKRIEAEEKLTAMFGG